MSEFETTYRTQAWTKGIHGLEANVEESSWNAAQEWGTDWQEGEPFQRPQQASYVLLDWAGPSLDQFLVKGNRLPGVGFDKACLTTWDCVLFCLNKIRILLARKKGEWLLVGDQWRLSQKTKHGNKNPASSFFFFLNERKTDHVIKEELGRMKWGISLLNHTEVATLFKKITLLKTVDFIRKMCMC